MKYNDFTRNLYWHLTRDAEDRKFRLFFNDQIYDFNIGFDFELKSISKDSFNETISYNNTTALNNLKKNN